jgi:basic membrane protein A
MAACAGTAIAPTAPPTTQTAPAGGPTPTGGSPSPVPTSAASPGAAFTASPVASPASAPASSPSASPAAASPGRPFRVGLVTDVGKVDDNGFNQSAWEGVQRAQRELGAQVTFIETTDPKDYGKNIDKLGQDGYDVIVTVGFAIGQATQEAAAKWKNVRFIGVDQFQERPVENLAGLVFEEDKAGYLAGALAGMLTHTNVVAAVLGTDLVPPVVKFGKGYEAGAKATKPEIKVLTAYHPGGLAKGFTDPDWGRSTTAHMVQQQADVIFAAGGTTGTGALLSALDHNVLAIGADADQWETLPQARPVLVSSALKLITPGVFDLIVSVNDGTFSGGNHQGQIGLAPFHDNADQVTDQARVRLSDIDRDLKSGVLRTNVVLP